MVLTVKIDRTAAELEALFEGTVAGSLTQDPLGAAAGSINYDPAKGIMGVRNLFTGSSIQVGHESVIFVINNTGLTIPDGKIVKIVGYDGIADAFEIELAIADVPDAASVIGVATTGMADGEVGLSTVFGRVNDLDTSSFSEGEVVYLSPTVAGEITATKPPVAVQIGHVGKVNATTGFIQVDVRKLRTTVFGVFSHLADQVFTANVSAPIAFNTNDEVTGITHDEVTDNEEFLMPPGAYQATIEPQYTRTSGGGTDVLNVFVARDVGAGFVNVPDSNVKFTIDTANATAVSPLTTTFRVTDAAHKIRFMCQVESANLILDFFAASGIAPNDIPATPSVILNITRIGD